MIDDTFLNNFSNQFVRPNLWMYFYIIINNNTNLYKQKIEKNYITLCFEAICIIQISQTECPFCQVREILGKNIYRKYIISVFVVVVTINSQSI